MTTPNDIKSWLKKIGESRDWLATKTFSTKRTVDNWLSDGRKIPDAKMSLIELLMVETDSEVDVDDSKLEPYGIMFTPEEHARISLKAKNRGMTFSEYLRYAILNPDAK